MFAAVAFTTSEGWRFFQSNGKYYEAFSLVPCDISAKELERHKEWDRIMTLPETALIRQRYDERMNDCTFSHESAESDGESSSSESDAESVVSESSAIDAQELEDLKGLSDWGYQTSVERGTRRGKQGSSSNGSVDKLKGSTPANCYDLDDDEEVIPLHLDRSSTLGLSQSNNRKTSLRNTPRPKPFSRPPRLSRLAVAGRKRPGPKRPATGNLPLPVPKIARRTSTVQPEQATKQADTGPVKEHPAFATAQAENAPTRASLMPAATSAPTFTSGIGSMITDAVNLIVDHDRSALNDALIKEYLRKIKASLSQDGGEMAANKLYAGLVSHLYSSW